MSMRFLCAAAVVAFSSVAASALETPKSVEQCNALLDEVTAGADPAKLNDETLNKLDELLTKAETQCEKSEFTDVVKTAEAIQAMMPAAAGAASGTGAPAAAPANPAAPADQPTAKN